MNKPTLAVALIVKMKRVIWMSAYKPCTTGLMKSWCSILAVTMKPSRSRVVTLKIYVNAKWPGFGPQRQLAQSYVQSDYVLWLDADERVTPELKQSILQAVAANKPDTLYQFARLSWVFGRFIRHSGWYPDRVLRLYPTQLTRYNDALVHERCTLNQA